MSSESKLNPKNLKSTENIRKEIAQTIKETLSLTKINQSQSNRKLEEEINYVAHKQTKIGEEHDLMKVELSRLKELSKSLIKVEKQLEDPIKCAQQCLTSRRNGGDQVEKTLLKEITAINKCKNNFRNIYKKAFIQFKTNEDALCGTNTDQLNEKQTTWIKWASYKIETSQKQRQISENLRYEIEDALRTSSREIWNSLSAGNLALREKISELNENKAKIQKQLKITSQEISEIKNSILKLQQTIKELQGPLNVAQTRLETNLKEPSIDGDSTTKQLQSEIKKIKTSTQLLEEKLKDSQLEDSKLSDFKAQLERDLKNIDELIRVDDLCLVSRKKFSCTFDSPIFKMPVIN